MDLPLVLRFGSVGVSAHVVLEVLAYGVAFQIYRALRRRRGDVVPDATRWTVIAAAAAGAALGSRLVLWLPALPDLVAGEIDVATWFAQKTIVGALLGGLVGVEVAKRAVGETRATGDLFALPLCVGIAIGRVGCFLAGTTDGTHGLASDVPWALDLGDGVARHPTALYEVAFVALLALVLARRRFARAGDVFKAFLAAYLAWRLAIDFWKPRDPLLGLSAIQWACVAGLVYYARDLPRLVRGADPPSRSEPSSPPEVPHR